MTEPVHDVEAEVRRTHEPETSVAPRKGGCLGTWAAVFGIVTGVVYLLLPSPLPDVVPLVGALDEAGATAMVIYLVQWLGKRRKGSEPS